MIRHRPTGGHGFHWIIVIIMIMIMIFQTAIIEDPDDDDFQEVAGS